MKDKQIFVKDINVPRKEQIIIDGRKRDCKILFRCKHIDDTAAYDMMCEGIEITPENTPVSDFELMLIEDTYSPFGFSFVCKRNNKEDVWEHSGFGNSGACSIVTALLKQLTCKTQECEELKKEQELNRCYKALEDIEEYIYTDCEYNDGCDRNICIRCKYSNVHDKKILDIINRAKEK